MTDRNTLINDLNSLFSSFWIDKGIDIENQKIQTNKFNACMMYIYENYISKLELKDNNHMKYSYSDYITIVEWYISKALYFDIVSIYGCALLFNRSVNWLYTIKNNSENISNMFVFDVVENNNSSVENNYNNSGVINKDSNDYNNYSGEISSININNSRDCQPSVGERVTMPIISITNKLFESVQYATVSKLNDTPLGLVTNANNNKDIGLMYAKERIQEQAQARLTIALSDLPKLE